MRRSCSAAACGKSPSPIPSGTALRPVDPNIDYTARDFSALRTLILTTVTRRVGTTVTPLTVDEVVALIEEMAYLGDALSYYEDAIATEAYLSTARRRISVYRHAALLNVLHGSGLQRPHVDPRPASGRQHRVLRAPRGDQAAHGAGGHGQPCRLPAPAAGAVRASRSSSRPSLP